MSDALNELKSKNVLDAESLRKLRALNNEAVNAFAAEYVELLQPKSVFVSDGSPADVEYVRRAALRNGEETALAIPGHTAHYDNYADQGRDKEHTLVLVPKGAGVSPEIATKERGEGLAEIRGIIDGIMRGREAFLGFYCLGPTKSAFSIPCVQLTDSAYVAHNENLLYRQGYGEFIRQSTGGNAFKFFKFVHSSGELDERRVSKNIGLRRIYIDLDGEIVYSANTQYGGNSVGLKKLAMRLAIKGASREGWLTEHMLILGVHGPKDSDGRQRKTFFTAAFPSLCGKTSTAMLEGESIVADDISFLRVSNGELRAANVEKGVFGIIQGINSADDPIQWRILNNPGEIIFSNVLVTPDKQTYWIGKDGAVPQRGVNHSGEWFPGKKDSKGKEIPASHPNARFTLDLHLLANLDEALDDPNGVAIGGIVYGGRDSDTQVPVEEAFDWKHGIVTKGAALESETTAATLGAEGVREINPMSNLDFLSVSVSDYVKMNLDFGGALKKPPKIFGVNYFLKGGDGRFLNGKNDKKAWFKWMELRCHNEVEAVTTPTGLIPRYEDLKKIFEDVLGKRYTPADYEKQFEVRVAKQLAKLRRARAFYKALGVGVPPVVFEEFDAQEKRLEEARAAHGGASLIPPSKLG